MIARPLVLDDDVVRTRVGTRSGRTAAHLRRGRTKRLRHAAVRRVSALLGLVTVSIVLYLGLTANVTRLNYELAKSARERARLEDVSALLDDRIARMASRERLAQLAGRLGMRDPQTFADVTLPAEGAPAPTGLAFLSWLR